MSGRVCGPVCVFAVDALTMFITVACLVIEVCVFTPDSPPAHRGSSESQKLHSLLQSSVVISHFPSQVPDRLRVTHADETSRFSHWHLTRLV